MWRELLQAVYCARKFGKPRNWKIKPETPKIPGISISSSQISIWSKMIEQSERRKVCLLLRTQKFRVRSAILFGIECRKKNCGPLIIFCSQNQKQYQLIEKKKKKKKHKIFFIKKFIKKKKKWNLLIIYFRWREKEWQQQKCHGKINIPALPELFYNWNDYSFIH